MGKPYFWEFVKMEYFRFLPPAPGRFGPDRPEGEISPSNGDIGWGVPYKGMSPPAPEAGRGS